MKSSSIFVAFFHIFGFKDEKVKEKKIRSMLNIVEQSNELSLVNFICEAKSVTKQDVLIVVICLVRLSSDPKPCFL